MIKKTQVVVGRFVRVYKDRGNYDYALITWVDQQHDEFTFIDLDTLIESPKFNITKSLDDLSPLSKKEVFLHFSNQQEKLDDEIKKLQDKKLHLVETHLKAKEFIQKITAK